MSMKWTGIRTGSLLLMCVMLASCSNNNTVPQTSVATHEVVTTEAIASNSDSDIQVVSTVANDWVTYDSDDDDSSWDADEANYIVLNNTSASIEGEGVIVDGRQIMIALPGTYVISGKLDDGQILVDLQSKGKVQLVLNGVDIHNADNAPIYVKSAQKTIITLQAGTENDVSDGTDYVYANSADDEPNAAIFSKDDLTINGTGTLTVNGNYNNGIMGKDDLKITGGKITINAVDDGLVGRDLLAVKAGDIRIKAAGDGIKSTNDTDAAKGLVVLGGGAYDITAGNDGIQAETRLLITDGDFTIETGGGSANSANQDSDNSSKGLKAATDISISGGAFQIDSSDDSIHSNNSIAITNGDITITSGDDGVHADSSITVTGGKVNIIKSYEGIESKLITLSGGDIHVTSSDDGINVGGGNDESSMNGRRGQNTLSTSGSDKLTINGGYIVVNASGDGLDSNGSIEMTAGTVIVNGPTGNNNGALDYDGTFVMSGGFLIAAGSSGMAKATSEQSTQHSIQMNYSQTQQAGTLIHLEDSNGNTVVTFAPDKNYQSIMINSPELNKDTTYTLYSGGTSTGTMSDGMYTDGVYQGGTEVVSFTITDSITWLSESGVTSGGSGGRGRGGR